MKRNKNRYFGLLLIAGMSFMLQSCLKNNEYYVDFSKGEPAIELPLAAQFANKPYGISWSPDTTTSFKLYVNVASVNKPSAPVTATIGIDNDWVTQYNASQSAAAIQAQQDYLDADPSHTSDDPNYPYSWTPMEVMPDSLYSISATDLTVPAGEREVFSDVLVHSDKFEPGHNYVLPFTITQSSINISSWNHLPLWFISSAFAGTYQNFHAHTVGGGYDETYDDVMTLQTIDQHTVAEPGSIADFFGGYTEYHFNGDGSVSVKAGTSSSSPNSYGAVVVSSSSDEVTGEFSVVFTILGGKYKFDVEFKR